jgi:bifunctional UDP-N-acetylglucosamine pyrophosphorylase/glucosamine-1-phosphate N-acetyltransferase
MQSTLPKVLHKVQGPIRLTPTQDKRRLPAEPLLGTPMIVKIINQAKLLNPKEILIVVGKYKNIKNIIEKTINQYVNIPIKYIIQEPALGTGHAIQCCRDYLSDKTGKVLVLSGDVPLVTSALMKLMLNNHKCTIMTTKLENPFGCGRIIVKNNKLIEIIEEKDATNEQKQIKLTNCGMYSFDVITLCKYLPYIQNNNAQKEYYLTDIIKIIKDNEQVEINMIELEQERQHLLTCINTKEALDELNNKFN